MISLQPTIWFDMDGVLVQHFAKDYYGSQPAFMQPNYFATLPIDSFAATLFAKLTNLEKTDSLFNIKILSKVNPDSLIYLQQIKDKQTWLEYHASDLNNKPDQLLQNSHFTATSKSKKAKTLLGRELTAHDILIDDWNENLIEWEQAGGTAIKYGKGNRLSWNGYSIQDASNPDQLVEFLKQIIK